MRAMAAANLRFVELPPVRVMVPSSFPLTAKSLLAPTNLWIAGNQPRSVAGQKLATLFRQGEHRSKKESAPRESERF